MEKFDKDVSTRIIAQIILCLQFVYFRLQQGYYLVSNSHYQVT